MENNNFIVSARKYRPSTFASVVGQKNLTATLQNAIATDRLAHSYLFCGSRGVGKTSCARIFAKTINCENRTPDGNPCNQCESCRSFNEGRSFNIIELDAASNNGVEDMRKIAEQVMVPPTNGRYRVFIIDEVHMLSSAAFNAFLKTLEEPPSYIIFILATTEKQKIIPTILSRCQIYDFNRISVSDITDHLEMVAKSENVTADRKALSVIATQADGALRDALSIFDQIVASSRGNITYQSVIDNLSILDNSYFIRLAKAFRESDVAEALLIFKEIRDKGFNTHFFIKGLNAFIRDLMVARDPRTLPLLDADEEEKTSMQRIAAEFPPEFFYMALSLINDADLKYKESSNKTFLTELLLIKLCQLLSPSPVFRGKEEGHLDSLLPLGASAKPVTKNVEPAIKAAAQAPSRQVEIKADAETRTSKAEKIHYKNTSLNVMSLKRHDSPEIKKTEKVSEDKHETEQSGSIRISIPELTAAWEAYAEKIPDRKIIFNVMRSAAPKVEETNPGTFFIAVANDLQKDIIEKEKNDILTFIESQLGVKGLKFEIKVEEGSIEPQMWSEKEILENMLASHPEMSKFIVDLDLSLS